MKKSKVELKRTNIYLTQEQIKRLTKLSEETGVPQAEMIRRAIDKYLDEKEGKQ